MVIGAANDAKAGPIKGGVRGWRRAEVAAALQWAAEAYERLPRPNHGQGYPRAACWPSFPPDPWFAYGSTTREAGQAVEPASAFDLRLVDETAGWLSMIDLGEPTRTVAARQVVIAKAAGCAWDEIVSRTGRSRATLQRLRGYGLDMIAGGLNVAGETTTLLTALRQRLALRDRVARRGGRFEAL